MDVDRRAADGRKAVGKGATRRGHTLDRRDGAGCRTGRRLEIHHRAAPAVTLDDHVPGTIDRNGRYGLGGPLHGAAQAGDETRCEGEPK